MDGDTIYAVTEDCKLTMILFSFKDRDYHVLSSDMAVISRNYVFYADGDYIYRIDVETEQREVFADRNGWNVFYMQESYSRYGVFFRVLIGYDDGEDYVDYFYDCESDSLFTIDENQKSEYGFWPDGGLITD